MQHHCLFNEIGLVSGASILKIIFDLLLSNRQTILLQKIFFCSPLLISKNFDVKISITWDLHNQNITIINNENTSQKIFVSEITDYVDIDIEQSTISQSKFYTEGILKKTVKQDQFYKFMKSCNYDFSNEFISVEEINFVTEVDDENIIIYGIVNIKFNNKLDILIDASFQSMVYALLQSYKVMIMCIIKYRH